MFSFGQTSRVILATVDTRLQRVAQRALELSSIDFGVVQGRRTLDEQRRLYAQGRTASECMKMNVPAEYARPHMKKVTWIRPENGNHLGGRAIDVCPFIRGQFNWDNDGKLGAWPAIASAFKRASAELGIPIAWGGDWQGSPDRPHFELKG